MTVKLSIYGILCPVCKGEQYTRVGRIIGNTLYPVDVACPECHGSGAKSAPPDIDRSGVEWERE